MGAPQPHLKHQGASYVTMRGSKQRQTTLNCHVNLVPPGIGLAQAPLLSVPVNVSGHVQFSSGDDVCHSCVTFLVLLSDNASLLEEENIFPNKIQHGDRIMHSMTLERAVRFVADPTVSEVSSNFFMCACLMLFFALLSWKSGGKNELQTSWDVCCLCHP